MLFKSIAAAALFFSLTAGTQAAEMINHIPNQPSAGTISASGATSPDEVIDMLSVKADKAGARAFHVTAIGGQNKLFGSAVIYR